MRIGVRYVVTKASDDGTFERGDHITANEDMTISCLEARGWIEKEDVPEATKGMECEVDKEWLQKKREKVEADLALLNALGLQPRT